MKKSNSAIILFIGIMVLIAGTSSNYKLAPDIARTLMGPSYTGSEILEFIIRVIFLIPGTSLIYYAYNNK